MTKLKKRGFTLIELIAVLVIMAILALIVTPLVMNIIRKAKLAADKRSIDAYGRSIELAIAGYLLDNGKFPTDVSELTIEYSGNKVECSTTQLNSDSSVYLTGCTVGGRTVDYTYGTDKTPPAPTYTAYTVGDHVSYNGVTYYVIEDSDTTNDTVKLLKENPLTVKEINDLNLDGITATGDDNSYGLVQYGSTTDYSTSTVKQVVDAWKNTAVVSGDTATARLITYDELMDNLGYNKATWDASYYIVNPEYTPTWVYNSSYWYWTMSQYQDSSYVWNVYDSGKLHGNGGSSSSMVRPVLELSKSTDITKVS